MQPIAPGSWSGRGPRRSSGPKRRSPRPVPADLTPSTSSRSSHMTRAMYAEELTTDIPNPHGFATFGDCQSCHCPDNPRERDILAHVDGKRGGKIQSGFERLYHSKKSLKCFRTTAS